MEIDLLQEPVAMVVEDHEALRGALCDWLGKSFKRCRVCEAGSVEDALRTVEEEHVDIMLMDVRLPGMSGIEGVRAIHDRAPHISVVIVSNYDDATHRAAAKEAGACAFVAKRTIHRELPSIMKELLVHAVFVKNPGLTTWVDA
jgi:DNA-binding NarL/FixJ family response regulator